MRVLFTFMLYLYLHYKAVVEPHQESQEVNSPGPNGQTHVAGGIHITCDCVFQKELATRSPGALAACAFRY